MKAWSETPYHLETGTRGRLCWDIGLLQLIALLEREWWRLRLLIILLPAFWVGVLD